VRSRPYRGARRQCREKAMQTRDIASEHAHVWTRRREVSPLDVRIGDQNSVGFIGE